MDFYFVNLQFFDTPRGDSFISFNIYPINQFYKYYRVRFRLVFYRIVLLQNVKSFQKQPTIFLNRKKGLGSKRRKSLRYHREVGLGFKTPREVRTVFFANVCSFPRQRKPSKSSTVSTPTGRVTSRKNRSV